MEEQPQTLTDTERRAAQMLITPSAIAPMTLGDALVVVDYMRPKRIPEGAVFIHAGESVHNDYMMLILEGDVTLELEASGDNSTSGTVVSTATAGEIVGEVSVFTGMPRSLTCRAATDIAVAILTRAKMIEMHERSPDVAARFAYSLMARMSYYMQENLKKSKNFLQMNDVLRYQLDKVMDTRGVPSHSRNNG